MNLLSDEVSYVIDIPWWVSLIFLTFVVAGVAALILIFKRKA